MDITVDAGVSFKGSVEEYGDGDITADIAGSFEGNVAGVFEGNVAEYGTGDVATDGAGTFKGNSEHELPGALHTTHRRFPGSGLQSSIESSVYLLLSLRRNERSGPRASWPGFFGRRNGEEQSGLCAILPRRSD